MKDKLNTIRAFFKAVEEQRDYVALYRDAYSALTELEQLQIQIFVEDDEITEVQWQGGTLDYEIIKDPFMQGMFYCERCFQWKLDKYLSFYSDDCVDCSTATESEDDE